MLYGLHPNAEIGFLTTTSETLFKTVFELQPRESGSSGGPVTTREDKIKALVDDVMEKLPEAFNMGEIMGKVEERTPYVVVAFQVCKETKDCFLCPPPLHQAIKKTPSYSPPPINISGGSDRQREKKNWQRSNSLTFRSQKGNA